MQPAGRCARLARWGLALSLIALPGLPVAASTAAPQDVFVLEGRGHGHGVGMAQDSAQAMAAAGAGHEQILQHFYPGTGRARRSSEIRVAVWEAGAPSGSVTLTAPGGARVSGDGRTADAPAGAVLQVSAVAGGYRVRQVAPARGSAVRAGLLGEQSPTPSPSPTGDPLPGGLPSAAPSPEPSESPSTSPSAEPAPSAPAPAGPSPAAAASPQASEPAPFVFDSSTPVTLDPLAGSTISVGSTGRTYRGSVLALSRQGFRLVNELDIEDYLRGLGEVPAGWPMAALRTQAVAARTYALRAVGGGRPLGYDLCDDTRCQVYLGVQGEAARTAQAARDTRGLVVTYRGALADTFYSANAGGVTATPGEGFGGSTTSPYLPAGTPAPGGLREWRLSVAPQDVAGRLGYAGRLESVSVVQKGPSGRATRVRLDGSSGPMELAGVAFQRRMGLRSTLFTVVRATGQAEALPAADAADSQLAPAEAATVSASPEAWGPPPSSARLRSGMPLQESALPAAVQRVPPAVLVVAAGALAVAVAAHALMWLSVRGSRAAPAAARAGGPPRRGSP